MTERKPPGVSFESWIDRQIREAMDRGEFDNLPGAGEPLPDLDKPRDESWWLRRKLQREGVSHLPSGLALRKEADQALEAVAAAGSEAEVRDIVATINEKIRKAIKHPTSGPPHNLMPFDVERLVENWRNQQQPASD